MLPDYIDGLARDGDRRPGYEKLMVWRNAAELRKLIYDITVRFPKNEYRRVSQMRDSARSVKQNIQEGYKRYCLGDYIRFLTIARGSLGELQGDVHDCLEDKLIDSSEFQRLDRLCGTTDYLFRKLIGALIRKKAKR